MKKETGSSRLLLISSPFLHNDGLCRSKCVIRDIWLIQIYSQIRNVTTDQKCRIFVNILFDPGSRSQERGPKLSQTGLPPPYKYTSNSQSISHLLCRKPLHLHTTAPRFLGLCSITCLKKHRDRSPAEKPQWKIAFTWNSSLFQRSRSSQLETHRCQNLPKKDRGTKWKCPGQATIVVKEAGVAEETVREQQERGLEEALSKPRAAHVSGLAWQGS